MAYKQMTDQQCGQIIRLADVAGRSKDAMAFIGKPRSFKHAERFIDELIYQLDACPTCGSHETDTARPVGVCNVCNKRWNIEPALIE